MSLWQNVLQIPIDKYTSPMTNVDWSKVLPSHVQRTIAAYGGC